MTYNSYNEFHLGDNLVHLNFLRRLALLYPDHFFQHWVQRCHLAELKAIADVPNVSVLPLDEMPKALERGAPAPLSPVGFVGVVKIPQSGADAPHSKALRAARNVWKNANGYWERSPFRSDWGQFHLDWFRMQAREMGLESPIRTVEDLLLNYPAICSGGVSPPPMGDGHRPPLQNFDILFINSQPCSGQFLDYDTDHCMDPMIVALIARGWRVICTQPTPCGCPCTRDYGLSLTKIGNLSLTTPYHIMVATGPMWPTFNIWNTRSTKLRLLMLGNAGRHDAVIPHDERMTILPDIVQVSSKAAAWAHLQKAGML